MSTPPHDTPKPTSEASALPRLREDFQKEADQESKKTRPKGSWAFRWLGYLSLACLLLILAGMGATYAILDDLVRDMPNIEFLEHYRPPVPSRILAADGSLIGNVAGEEQKRVLVTLDQIPPQMTQALISLEDKRFYEHPGISPRDMLRALYVDLRAGWFKEGASTVTTLLAKNLFVIGEKGRGNRYRTVEQKVREALLALQIERRFSKDEILELFLNQAPMGRADITGVGAAAQYFFGKNVSDLNLKECALFVGMLKAPSNYDPISRPDRAQARTVLALKAMLDDGKITQAEFEKARDEDFQLVGKKNMRVQTIEHPYAYYEVRKEFEIDQAFSGPHGPLMLKGTGYDVATTLDPVLQNAAREALKAGLIAQERFRRSDYGYRWGTADYNLVNGHTSGKIQHNMIYDGLIVSSTPSLQVVLKNMDAGTLGPYEVEYPKRITWLKEFGVLEEGYFLPVELDSSATPEAPRFIVTERDRVNKHAQGGIVALQPSTGKILAMVGGYDFDDRSNAGMVNRVVQSKKIPGSAFKPLLYSAAVCEAGYTPATILHDEGRTYGEWTPKNFENQYFGDVTMEFALAESLNAASVALLDTFMGSRTRGWKTVVRFCHDTLGLELPPPHNLTMALGTKVVTPLELAKAYSVIASGGIYREPYLVESVRDRQRNEQDLTRELFTHRSIPRRTMDARDAAVCTFLLSGPTRYGTAHTVSEEFDIPLVGKTGTTDLCVEAWFAGFGKDLVCVVYVGHDYPRSLGKRRTGSQVALPIWKDFMHQAIEAHPELFGEFVHPEGVVELEVSNKTGRLANEDTPPDERTKMLFRSDRTPQSDEARRIAVQFLADDVNSVIERPLSQPFRFRHYDDDRQWFNEPDQSNPSTPRPIREVEQDTRAGKSTTEARKPEYVPSAAERDLRSILEEPTPTPSPTPKPKRGWFNLGRFGRRSGE